MAVLCWLSIFGIKFSCVVLLQQRKAIEHSHKCVYKRPYVRARTRYVPFIANTAEKIMHHIVGFQLQSRPQRTRNKKYFR